MKRLFMVVVAMLSMTMTFAENENAANLNNAEAYNMTVNMKNLLHRPQVKSVRQWLTMPSRRTWPGWITS